MRSFVNADLIAAGLSPLAPEKELMAASRLFLTEIKSHIFHKTDFAFETTLSGRGYLKLIEDLRKSGWQIELIYLALPAVDMSIERVAERVLHGGHDIPRSDIERRFPKSLRNLLQEYSHIVHECTCFMNVNETPELIFTQKNEERIIVHEAHYKRLEIGADL
jgi:predicted ABC-type ATPase